jgi:hypothetical protein
VPAESSRRTWRRQPSPAGQAQLIVTTYEHAIAHQLSEDIDGVSILRINRTELLVFPPRPGDQATQAETVSAATLV